MNMTSFGIMQTAIGPQKVLLQHPRSAGPGVPHSTVSSIKSLMNLRAQSRPHTRPVTGNPNLRKNDQEILFSMP